VFEPLGLFKSIKDVPAGAWRWLPFIGPDELACHGDGSILIVPDFLDLTVELRKRCGFPFRFTSFYRSPAYNTEVADTGPYGPHTTGRAFDLSLGGVNVHALTKHAIDLGFTGFGYQQKGPYATRFVHVDNLPAGDGRLRPLIWTY
jgi:hypothetical protein